MSCCCRREHPGSAAPVRHDGAHRRPSSTIIFPASSSKQLRRQDFCLVCLHHLLHQQRQGMRCPSLLTNRAGLSSSRRSSSSRRHPNTFAQAGSRNFQSLVTLAAKLFLPWITTPESMLTASGTCGMSRMSLAKPCSSRSSRTRRCPQTCASSRSQTSQMSTHSPRRYERRGHQVT